MITEIDILKLINTHRLVEADALLIFLSFSAYLISAAVVFAIAIYGFVRFRKYYVRLFFFMFCSLALSTTVVCLLKYGINRVRPNVEEDTIVLLTSASSPSFPSGHTTITMVVYFTLSIYSDIPGRYRLLCLLWAVIVAYSRLALGAHYPSDVAVAILIAYCCVIAVKRLMFGLIGYNSVENPSP